MYNPINSPIKKAFSNDPYWSDSWDPYEYGREFDFSRPFFEQFHELNMLLPRQALDVDSGTMVNTDYSNMCGHMKDCYLSFKADFNERCMYTRMCNKCTDVINSEGCYETELSYSCIRCQQCYNSKYLFQCVNCLDSMFCYDSSNLQNCFGCFNLKNKQYCIYNEQKTQKEYEQFIMGLPFGSREGLKKIKKEVEEKVKGKKARVYFGIKNEDVTGNYLYESKNAHHCYDVRGAEDCTYVDHITLARVKDCMDYYLWGAGSELVYEAVICGEGAYNVKFCLQCWPGCTNMQYCISCHSSDSLFGCVGLKKGKYAIFNKKYSQVEYEKLKARIIDHMKSTGEYGEFFPMWMSPFAYNESDAGVEYAQLSETEIKAKGWRFEKDTPGTFGKHTKTQQEVPDDINAVGEDIVREILECTDCKKNYKITKQELAFYKKMKVPIPEVCWLCGIKEHLNKLPGFDLYDRKCATCNMLIQTAYAPSRPETVLCEACYQKEIV